MEDCGEFDTKGMDLCKGVEVNKITQRDDLFTSARKEYSYEGVGNTTFQGPNTARSNGSSYSDVEMNTDTIEKLQPKTADPDVDNYYMWMLQKVMGSIPDIDIYKKEEKLNNSSDGDSINDYNNQTTINYFNSFD
jgi:hypothetical protein